MTSTRVPQILNYKNVKPRGIPTQYKTMRFTPLTSFNSYITNDIVRFWIPMIKGFWDPYKSYIQIQVQVSETDFPYGHGIQVDNSASSFINQMTVFVDSKQIQRIQEYDTIAALLHDAMYRPADKHGKEYEGYGYGSHDSLGTAVDTRRNMTTLVGQPRTWGQLWGTTTTAASVGNVTVSPRTDSMYSQRQFNVQGYFPEHPLYITPNRVVYPVINSFMWTSDNVLTTSGSNLTGITGSASFPQGNSGAVLMNNGNPRFAFPRSQKGYSDPLFIQNPSVASPNGIPAGNAVNNTFPFSFAIYSRAHPCAFQFLFLHCDNNSFQCICDTVYGVGNTFSNKQLACGRPWLQSHIQSSCYGLQGTNATNFSLYDTYNFQSASSLTNANNVNYAPGYYPLISSVAKDGYSQAFSEQLSNSSYETLFTPAHPQSWIYNGTCQATPVKTNKRVFQVPIISSIFGVLIPAESYKLLPMQAFKNLMIQFRLNEYAMFTSGYLQSYSDPAQNTDIQSMVTQLKRQWKINRIQIWGAIYQFDDFVTSMTDSMLRSGITLCSSGWNIGPRFSLTTTQSIQNSWQINAGYQSLKTLFFRIQSDDYKRYSFCRQHYYYSGNVTSLQLKIANTYIPPQPIQGHAGNILPVLNQKSNANFIIELHKVFGQLFNVGSTMYINSTNFALNDRPYDPTNVKSYRNASDRQVQNIDTAHGLPLFHQNRCVGRALYAFDLEAIPGQPEVISGLDTTQWRPFEVLIDTETPAFNGRDSTLVFIMNYDVVYVLKADSPPDVMGRGSS